MPNTSDTIPNFPCLNLPDANLRICHDNNIIKVYDKIRRKKVILTPEEYVRQTFTSWMITHLHYPPSLMANEVGIELNGLKKRCDTIVFKSDGNPLMIVEYKAPEIPISQSVFDQIVRYNISLKADYLVVSNGISHFCCSLNYNEMSYSFLKDIPDYLSIKNKVVSPTI